MATLRMLATLAVILGWAVLPAAADLPMGEVAEFPHAGIALAIPQDHQMQTVSQPFDVMRAAAYQNNQPSQAITLSAIPISQVALTAEMLADAMIASQGRNLAIRNLQVLNKAVMKVSDLDGAARLLSYNLRGDDAVAAMVYFVREIEQPKIRICYVLTVEAPASRKSDVLPTLGEVVKTVRLTAPQHPTALAITRFGSEISDPQGRFSIRPPLGWYASPGPAGLSMAQTDYLLGGLPTVSAHMVVTSLETIVSTEQQMEHCVQTMQKTATERNLEGKLLSRERCPFAGQDAFQVVFEQSVKTQPASAPASAAATQTTEPASQSAKTDLPASVVIAQRSFCLPSVTGPKAQSYSLVLVGQGMAPEAAGAVMNKLAESFQLRQAGSAGTPTTASAPATSPAAPAK